MGLPLPKVVADVGPGGPMVTGMRGANALSQDILNNQINAVKAQYAPLTTQADAASKMAYANLMGPQFLAKLMGNDSFVANLGDERAKMAVPLLYQAGTGQGSGNSLRNLPEMSSRNNSNNSFLDMIKNGISNIFGKGNNNSDNSIQSKPYAENQEFGQINQASPEFVNHIANNGNNKVQLPGMNKNIFGTPQQAAAINRMTPGSAVSIGDNGQPISVPSEQNIPSYEENTAKYKGIVGEGEEAGKIRAKNIDELNNTVFNAENNQTTLDDMASILLSPEIEQIRKVPLAGHLELGYYSKEGTPQQQRLVGKLYTLMGNFVKDSSRDFAGAFRKGEQQLLQSMKPNPNDTVDVMRGKVETLSFINQMLRDRSRLTSKIMEQKHFSKGNALEEADKLMNGDKLRGQIKEKLYPKITITNKKTGEKRTVTREEAMKLGVQNV